MTGLNLLEKTMNFCRVIAAVSVLIAATASAEAQAQGPQRTVASAHEFLRTVMGRGTTDFNVVNSNNPNITRGHETIDRVEGSQCQTSLYATHTDSSGTHSVWRRIDWSRVSSVSGNSTIYVAGSITATNGEILDGVEIRTESYELGQRIIGAMEFLRNSCDSTGKTGF